jgi:hypothetical protein
MIGGAAQSQRLVYDVRNELVETDYATAGVPGSLGMSQSYTQNGVRFARTGSRTGSGSLTTV